MFYQTLIDKMFSFFWTFKNLVILPCRKVVGDYLICKGSLVRDILDE